MLNVKYKAPKGAFLLESFSLKTRTTKKPLLHLRQQHFLCYATRDKQAHDKKGDSLDQGRR